MQISWQVKNEHKSFFNSTSVYSQMHIYTQERLILNIIVWGGYCMIVQSFLKKVDECATIQIYIYIGRTSQMYLVLIYKLMFCKIIHFALPKCHLNLDQHEYKLLQLSSSASQCDTWVNMHSILLICISVIHEIQKYIGIFEKICTVWKPKVLFGESVVDFFI